MKQIGLIFDMDGVLVDNHEYHFLSWQKLAGKYDISIDEHFYREKMNGRTLMELMRVVFNKPMEPAEARSIGMEKEALYRELYHDYRALTPGLVNFLESAKKAGIPMAVGTSAPKENVIFTLDGLNIRHYFVDVVDDRAVTKGKPDPEVYLKCADAIQRIPSHCIVFEDALSGIQAGKSAGAKVVALATSHKREELVADLIIDDFRNFNLQDVFKLIG